MPRGWKRVQRQGCSLCTRQWHANQQVKGLSKERAGRGLRSPKQEIVIVLARKKWFRDGTW